MSGQSPETPPQKIPTQRKVTLWRMDLQTQTRSSSLKRGATARGLLQGTGHFSDLYFGRVDSLAPRALQPHRHAALFPRPPYVSTNISTFPFGLSKTASRKKQKKKAKKPLSIGKGHRSRNRPCDGAGGQTDPCPITCVQAVPSYDFLTGFLASSDELLTWDLPASRAVLRHGQTRRSAMAAGSRLKVPTAKRSQARAHAASSPNQRPPTRRSRTHSRSGRWHTGSFRIM